MSTVASFIGRMRHQTARLFGPLQRSLTVCCGEGTRARACVAVAARTTGSCEALASGSLHVPFFPTPPAAAPRRMWEEGDGWMIERFGNIQVGDMTWDQSMWSDLVRCWHGWAR